MSMVLISAAAAASCSTTKWKAAVFGKRLPCRTSPLSATAKPFGFRVNAFFFNPFQEPILKQAVKGSVVEEKLEHGEETRVNFVKIISLEEKEPVAFAGGIFAGLLRLDLNEDPLKEWVARTVEASGVTAEEIEASDDQAEEDTTPQQIEIE
ncbi:protein, chloroplastic isoform X1 [Capsicum galapagoense]